MSFSEKTKLEVRQKAAFQCCRCHEIGIDVHHIIPEADNGPNEFDNAAPLCQNCHDRFGANPEKRKEIRQMRDWWYEVVKEKYYGDPPAFQKLNDLLLRIQDTQQNQTTAMKDVKAEIFSRLEEIKINLGKDKNSTPSQIRHIASEFISATRLASGIHANFLCQKCGTTIGLLIGSNNCPTCGALLDP